MGRLEGRVIGVFSCLIMFLFWREEDNNYLPLGKTLYWRRQFLPLTVLYPISLSVRGECPFSVFLGWHRFLFF